ncbi:MAG: hypothetical protein ABR928_18595 [Terracidiphilus sp.]|jgi:hypothetical protein
MKRLALILCFSLTILIGGNLALAQSADDTLMWLRDFVAKNGGDSNGHVFRDAVIVNGSGQSAMFYSEIKNVENWYHGNDSGPHFVRVSGAIHDCSDMPGGTCFGACPSSAGYFDIELPSNNNRATIDRIVKALSHLAELNGAKVNQKEPF